MSANPNREDHELTVPVLTPFLLVRPVRFA